MSLLRLRSASPACLLGLIAALAGCGDVSVNKVSILPTPGNVLKPEAPAEPTPTPSPTAPPAVPKVEVKKAAQGALGAMTIGLKEPAPKDAPAPAVEAVRLEAIKYADLKGRIAALPGKKYALMDVWSSTCGPCKENFPHVVQLHERLGKKGLAVISLSLDPPDEPDAVASAEAFLRAKGATFTNWRMDEDPTVVYEALDFSAIPAVFLFKPDGSLLKKFTWDDPNHQFTYDEVEKAVEGLLKDAGANG